MPNLVAGLNATTPRALEQNDGSRRLSNMHRSNTDGNSFEAIYSEETAKSGATEFLVETSRLDIKQPELDSGGHGDTPQLNNDGLEQSGLEQSGLK